MMQYQNDCVCCDLPCNGMHRHVAHYYCDWCEREIDNPEVLTDINGDEVCPACYLEWLKEE